MLIWNIDIEKSSRKTNEWIINREDDYPITLNEVLISHIKQDENIIINELPDKYLDDSIIDKGELLQICNEILTQLNATGEKSYNDIEITTCPSKDKVENITGTIPWISWSGVFGLFRTQKESIISDVEKLIENYNSFKFEKLKVETYQTSTISGVETDPSQEKIINSINKTQKIIIQGPPGTGKSQTLTAIITNALENGAKCLVVCEKKTALNVIYNNLNEIGCSKFCAIIDDVSKDRKKIIETVRGFEKSEFPINCGYREQLYENKLKDFNSLKENLINRHKAVLIKIFGDYNWKEVIGNFLNQSKKNKTQNLKTLLKVNDYDFTYKEYQKLLKVIHDGEYYFKEINNLNHPLNKLNNNIFINKFLVSKKIEIEEKLIELKKMSESQIKDINKYISEFDKIFTNYSYNFRIICGFISFFSKKYKNITKIKLTTINNYKKLINQHNDCDLFNYCFIDIEGLFDLNTIRLNIENYIVIINSLLSNFSSFHSYYNWKNFSLNIKENERKLIISLIKINASDWKAALDSWYYNNILQKYEADIGPFNTNSKIIEELASLTIELKKMQQMKINDKWQVKKFISINRFNRESGNINNLYNLRKNKQYARKNSLRRIIHKDFDLFTDFFPVLMVNPVVACSILPLKECIFDVVIFDEASQLRLEDTYTSLIRGKYKIISGDIHQMPPSNYFGNEIILSQLNEPLDDSEWEESPDELADKDSLLEYTIDSNYEKTYLDFHYRSRHPFLIDFSNAAFYGSRLSPMPENTSYKPIRFVEVNGCYEKNRTNPNEAEKVVDILFNKIPTLPNGEYPSVGIATFNLEQRNKILEIIRDKCFMDENVNKKHENLIKNGLFVKNLENIQGDERDIIILSTTFGLNIEGNFRQSFGPINQLKGYKLLNVIITRAKHKLFVCTSIPKEYYERYEGEIATNRNIGKGIFYAYLAYAKAIEEDNSEKKNRILSILKNNCSELEYNIENSNIESPFEQEVYEYLIGYINKERIKIQYQYGGFRIDFVILSKFDNKPLIAIECDGASYHAKNESYSYDLFRQKLIEERLKLKFYRIWSTNWWTDPIKEINSLVEFIESNDTIERDIKLIENELYYTNDWLFDKSKPVSKKIDASQVSTFSEPVKIIEDKKTVTANSIVTIKYLNNNKKITFRFTNNKNEIDSENDELKTIFVDSPLANSLMNKSEGEKLKIHGIEVYCKIIKIIN